MLYPMIRLICSSIVIFTLLGVTPTWAARLEWAIISDAGEWTAEARSVQASILKTPVRNLILPGDNLYTSTYVDVWNHWSEKNFKFDIVAIGNHNAGYAEETRFFRMPGEYYSKVFGAARFIILNSDNIETASAQAAFLASELSAAQEPFVFIVYHHPTYTLSHIHSWDEKKSFQLAIRPVLKKFRSKITALFVGHDHLALLAHYDDLPVILSGAVKEVRSDTPVSGIQDGVTVTTDWMFNTKPHWARLTLQDGATAARVDFIRATDDQLVCSVTLKTGIRAKLSPGCASGK